MASPQNADIDSAVTAAMRAWDGLVNHHRPWSAMPLDDRNGEIRDVVRALFESAATAAHPMHMSDERFLGAADAHAQYRRRQGTTFRDLHRDLQLMRLAVQESLRARPLDGVSTHALVQESFILCAIALNAARALSWNPSRSELDPLY